MQSQHICLRLAVQLWGKMAGTQQRCAIVYKPLWVSLPWCHPPYFPLGAHVCQPTWRAVSLFLTLHVCNMWWCVKMDIQGSCGVNLEHWGHQRSLVVSNWTSFWSAFCLQLRAFGKTWPGWVRLLWQTLRLPFLGSYSSCWMVTCLLLGKTWVSAYRGKSLKINCDQLLA